MEKYKISVTTNLIISAIFALLGLMISFKPNLTLNIIVNVIGTVFLVYGILKIVNYVKAKKELMILENNLIFGIIALIIGLCVYIFGRTVIALIRIAIGMWIVYSSILKFQHAIQIKNIGLNSWKIIAIFATFMLIGGIIIIANSGAITSLAGVLLIVYSVIDIIENIYAMKNINKIYMK